MMQWSRNCLLRLGNKSNRDYNVRSCLCRQTFLTLLQSKVIDTGHARGARSIVSSCIMKGNKSEKEPTQGSGREVKENSTTLSISDKTHSERMQKNSTAVSSEQSHGPLSELSAEYFKTAWLQSQSGKGHRSALDVCKEKHPVTGFGRGKDEDDGDVFGALLPEDRKAMDHRHYNERLPELIPEEKDRDFRLGIPLTRYGRIGKKAFYYTKKMSKLGKQGKVREAIEVYDEIMMKRDRVLPKKRTFVTLIGILGRVGYTRKAFQLFREMRKMGYDTEDHIYTSLFNACANSPSRADGLARAEKLIRYMQENQVKPNLFTVKSCMKALAVCGDFPRAFAVLDEAATRMKLDSECFNSLLIACVSDRAAGFLRALMVWQKMREMHIQPEAATFNLLLRCVRDCGVGDPEKLQHIPNVAEIGDGKMENERLRSQRTHFPPVKPKSELDSGLNLSSELVRDPGNSFQNSFAREKNVFDDSRVERSVMAEEKMLLSSYVDVKPIEVDSRNKFEKSCNGESSVDGEWWEQDASKVQTEKCSESLKQVKLNRESEGSAAFATNSLTLKDLEKPEVRLRMVGGAGGFLRLMEDAGAEPDIRTFTQMLACVANDEASEVALLDTMEGMGWTPDVDFLNDIMMRRFRRKEYDTIMHVLGTMSKLNLTPNMRTYAALALTCNTKEKAVQLLEDMKVAGVEPTDKVLSHLLQASYSNYSYKLHVLKTFEDLDYKPTTRMLTTIEKSIALAKQKIAEAEKDGDIDSFYLSESFTIPLRNFLNYYRQWLQRTELDRPEHPWKAFEPIETEEEEITETDRRKQKA